MVRNTIDNTNLEIIGTLLSGPAHVREIARKTGLPHPTISRRLQDLTAMNCIDSEEHGRNKSYFLKKTVHAQLMIYLFEMYRLHTSLMRIPTFEIVLKELLSITDAPLLILFGSYSSSTQRKDSDIDIYAETYDKTLPTRAKLIHPNINIKIGRFDMTTHLAKEIIKNHIIIRGVERFYEKISISHNTQET